MEVQLVQGGLDESRICSRRLQVQRSIQGCEGPGLVAQPLVHLGQQPPHTGFSRHLLLQHMAED